MEISARWRAPILVMGAALLLPMMLTVAFDLPRWLMVILLVLSLAAGAMGVRQVMFHREQAAILADVARSHPKPVVEQAPEEHHVPAIPIDSAEPYYRFVLSCKVCWTGGEDGEHGNPRGLAVHAILERARQITVTCSPADAEAALPRLAAELGAKLPDRSGQIVAWAHEVGLAVPESDAARIARLAELRKEKQVLHQERELEQSTRAYLAENVFTDPGTAAVWWLARHPEQVREAAALLPTFAELTTALRAPAPHYAQAERDNGARLTGQDDDRRLLPRTSEPTSDDRIDTA
ncbi:hypothetical protein [Actinokineospora xionganensis]|uniref:Uncharacterized protein n=1 Tax=Actinokineospora xionganensis TaxID=2684470 RepID=A0ABR7L695_9PSEU|nr:hypothetical protein [Actinokineospora xionganensis]MBC6448213.1 hypothetical protein [Actinokineospora xionganensis]